MTMELAPLETVPVPGGPTLDSSLMAEIRHADVTVDVEADDRDGRRVALPRHFLIPVQDRVVEVAAWTMQVLEATETGATSGPRHVEEAQTP
jgi:hypothetical protein